MPSKEAERDMARLETCTSCGIRTGHTISCPVGGGNALDDKTLRAMWRAKGGEFHGPNVETGTMPEIQLLQFLRSLVGPSHPSAGGKDAAV